MPSAFDELFATAMAAPDGTSIVPYGYQHRLATDVSADGWPDLLHVPTGLGKTAAVTLAWLFQRGWRGGGRNVSPDSSTPRRLVWCLPMRVLVEQTERNVIGWLKKLDIFGGVGEGKVSVHVLMGGADDVKSWTEYPEEDMILIGTQDMLLSRALMRGYGMSRYQWPVDFALLHNDAFWVFDEVQLMGAGLATSTQLEAFRRSLPLGRGSRSLWLSATLNREWLSTVDLQPHLDSLVTLSIDDDDRRQAGARLAALKKVERAHIVLGKDASSRTGRDHYLESLCSLVLGLHQPSSQTLVIVNRVDRAQGLFRLLQARRSSPADLLVHSRFRAQERAEQARRLSDDAQADRIVVATQAIEAGVDITSAVLVTELAPWSSMVQRFGRCNRYGEENDAGGARILWIDQDDDADALPYKADELMAARQVLVGLESAGPGDLPSVGGERPLTAVLRRKDLIDLFNTDPDLSGFDVDVSDYIRDTGVPGLQAFWRQFDEDPNESTQAEPHRLELCPVSIGQAKDLHKRGAWRWDGLDEAWVRLDRNPRPGMTLLLRAKDGGYSPEIGFDGSSKPEVNVVVLPGPTQPPESPTDDPRSRAKAVGLGDHLAHVTFEAATLCSAMGMRQGPVVEASRWHDVGKAHPVFQATMHGCAPEDMAGRTDFLAKSTGNGRHRRRYFRHELVSMLAWLEHGDLNEQHDLIAYLIAAHHGKVRLGLRALPSETGPREPGRRFARGVWEGDVLPALVVNGRSLPQTRLSLALMELGEGEMGPSWTARTLALLREHGPFALAWMEMLVRVADGRASRLEQAAPLAGGTDGG